MLRGQLERAQTVPWTLTQAWNSAGTMLRCSHAGLPTPAKSLQEKTWRPHSPWDKEDSVTFLLPCRGLWRSQLHADSLRWMPRPATRSVKPRCHRHGGRGRDRTDQDSCVLGSGVLTACSLEPRLAFPSLPAAEEDAPSSSSEARSWAGIAGTRQEAACGRAVCVGLWCGVCDALEEVKGVWKGDQAEGGSLNLHWSRESTEWESGKEPVASNGSAASCQS